MLTSTTEGSMSWLAYQIAAVAEASPASRGPSPQLGRWRSGRTSEVVHTWLATRERARMWWTRDEIILGTGRSQKAVDWALLFLRGTGAVEITSDPRCSRYHRYRAAVA